MAQLVQKIMLDEMLHSKGDFAIIDILLDDPAWEQSFLEIKGELKEILDEVRTKNTVGVTIFSAKEERL